MTEEEEQVSPVSPAESPVVVESEEVQEVVAPPEPLQEVEPEPLPEPEVSEVLSSSRAEMERASAEKKRLSIQAGQRELEKIRKELDEKAAAKRDAVREASQRSEQNNIADMAPTATRTKEESWGLVCDLVDFKRDTKADMSVMRAVLLQLKHG
ncbi:hypothetical protein HOP50_01g00910 [Chloropicon primus]|nr:hypothetical protein HOP50_01g00910 [Chloropicon primus]